MNLSGLNSSNSSGLMGSIKLKTDFDRQNEVKLSYKYFLESNLKVRRNKRK